MAKKKKATAELRHLKPSDYKTVPWKNGRGQTLELAVDTEVPFRWRLSRAKLVEAGPFSVYAGYDRKLMMLDGTSIRLEPEGKSLSPWEIYAFAGELPLTTVVKTPGEDLNLFTLRSRARATLHCSKFESSEEMQFPFQGNEHFVCALSGEIEYLEPSTSAQGILKAGETLWITRPAEVNLLNLRTCGTGAPAVAAWAIVTLEG